METNPKRGRRGGKNVPCFQCGNVFYSAPSRVEKNSRHHCSRQCSSKTLSQQYSTKVKRECFFCKKPVYYKASHANTISYPSCSDVCKKKIRSIAYSKDKNPRSLGLNNIDRYFWEKAKDCERRAKIKKWPYDIDHIFLRDLFQKQEGRCHYSGIPMSLFSEKGRTNIAASYNVASVDRIDSNRGYTKDNIVWTINCINMFKGHHDMNDIREVFVGIVNKESTLNVKVKLLYPDAKMPESSSNFNSGIDTFVHRVEDCGSYIKVYSGISVSPGLNHYFMLAPRSSIYKKGLIMHNSLGIIDTNYTGEIIGIFYKTTEYQEVLSGERIMQLVPQILLRCKFEEVNELPSTDRGDGGFGSTGK